jgi:hypothetical protein
MAVAAIASTETTCEYNIFLVYVQLFFTLGLGRTREQRIDLYFPSALASYIPQLTACFHSGKNRLSQSLYIAPIHSSGDQDKSRGCNLIYMLHIKSPRILNTLLCGDLVASSTETGTLHGTIPAAKRCIMARVHELRQIRGYVFVPLIGRSCG